MGLLSRLIHIFFPKPKPAPTPNPTPVPEPPVTLDADRQAIVLGVNLTRSKHGLPPLVVNENLDKLAQSWAAEMDQHVGMTHGNFGARFEAVFPNSYGEENICIADSPTQAMDEWNNSPLHLANMVSRRVTRIGVGRSGRYWCVDFCGQGNPGSCN